MLPTRPFGSPMRLARRLTTLMVTSISAFSAPLLIAASSNSGFPTYNVEEAEIHRACRSIFRPMIGGRRVKTTLGLVYSIGNKLVAFASSGFDE